MRKRHLRTSRMRYSLLGFLAASLMWAGTGGGAASRPEAAASLGLTKQQALDAYAALPLAFTENAGQTDARVRHYAHAGRRFSVFLTAREARFLFRDSGEDGMRKVSAIALRFLGSNPEVAIRGEGKRVGTVNYLVSHDPRRWHTGLSTYERVVYHDLWPGVDMALQGLSGKLKYEFLVRPGADVGQIRLAYEGAARLAVQGDGNLLVATPTGELEDERPISYQLVGGERRPVPSSFALDEEGTAYGFTLNEGYDPSYPLVIDPGLAYSTFLGGTEGESSAGIAVDAWGHAFVVGQTESIDFPTTVGALNTTSNSPLYTDVFVTKLNADGSGLVYSTYLGGSHYDGATTLDIGWGMGIAVDLSGCAYITGVTRSLDFPVTAGAFDTTADPFRSDAFVTKLNADGSALVYSTYLGAGSPEPLGPGGAEHGLGIAVDASGSAYVTGFSYVPFAIPDFPTTPGALDTTFNGGSSDAFVTKLDATGSSLVYSTYLGGSGPEMGFGIAVDASGYAYVTGRTSSPDFPVTGGAFDPVYEPPPQPFGNSDAFVTKLDVDGSALVYSTYLGGGGPDCVVDDGALQSSICGDHGRAIAVDSGGHAYITGLAGSHFPTTPGAFATSVEPLQRGAFVTKLDPSGSSLLYSTYVPERGLAHGGLGIGVDAAGSAHITGGEANPLFFGVYLGSIAKLNPAGSVLLYASTGPFVGKGIAVDPAGSAYVTGFVTTPDFPTTPGAFDRTFNAGDAFVLKLVFTGACCSCAGEGEGNDDGEDDSDGDHRYRGVQYAVGTANQAIHHLALDSSGGSGSFSQEDDLGCQVLTEEECLASGGTFLGFETECSNSACTAGDEDDDDEGAGDADDEEDDDSDHDNEDGSYDAVDRIGGSNPDKRKVGLDEPSGADSGAEGQAGPRGTRRDDTGRGGSRSRR